MEFQSFRAPLPVMSMPMPIEITSESVQLHTTNLGESSDPIDTEMSVDVETPPETPSDKKIPRIKTVFPQTRVRTIIKTDKDVQTVSAESVYAITVATELFLEILAKESMEYASREGKSRLAYKHVCCAVNEIQEFEFLSDIVPYTMPWSVALEKHAAHSAHLAASKVVPPTSSSNAIEVVEVEESLGESVALLDTLESQ